MKRIQLLTKIYLASVAVMSLGYLGLEAPGLYYMLQAKRAIAASGFPQQFGLTNVTAVTCETGCNVAGVDTCCKDGAGSLAQNCSTLSVAQCPTYQDVGGTMAGGDGNNFLITLVAAQKIGLKNGGQVIAGGTTNLMLLVSASVGGKYDGP